MKVSVKHTLIFAALFFGAYAEFQAQQTIAKHNAAKKKTEKHPSTLSVATGVLNKQ